MLVLTRKVGEGIAIGDDVKIVVMQIKGKQVRLGIKASTSTSVHREEIYQKIQEENRAASQASNRTILAEADSLFRKRAQEAKAGQVPLRRHAKLSKNDGDDGANDNS